MFKSADDFGSWEAFNEMKLRNYKNVCNEGACVPNNYYLSENIC